MGEVSSMKTRRRIVICAVCVLGIVAASFLLFSTSPTDEEIGRALSTTIVKRMNLKDAPARDAVEIIRQAYREQHPEMPDLRVVIHPSKNNGKFVDTLGNTGSLDLRDVPADIALEYVCYTHSVCSACRGGTLYFYAPTMSGKPPPLTTWEIFKDDVGELGERVRKKVWSR
jgi:hypothetical protein